MLKRYVAIERMRRAGVKPSDYMLDKIPVIPPIYRPITSHNGLTMVADSNYLYAQLMDARDDAREAKNLPPEFQQQAFENIYTKWKELTGLYAPQDIKLQSKHVQGLLKWALGDSPKFSALQRKVLSATVDTVGRGAVVPDPRLKLNELGVPEEMAFNIMAPFVERSLVKRGYTPLQAMKKVKERDAQARDVLNEVLKDHPVFMNRAPTLHKLGIIAYKPRLVAGHAIRVNPSTVVPFNMDFDVDTVNIHAPVSDKARREAYNKMFPERNLIGMRSRSILYKPEKEYQQGLYIATRMKSGDNVRTRYFNTIEEAKQAYRDGLIDIDDPIEIKQR
jgi:DNA-directed RNA polymerase subunit beta'